MRASTPVLRVAIAALGYLASVGDVEFDAPWRTGYGQMTVIRFPAR
jgi:hypothetical protein